MWPIIRSTPDPRQGQPQTNKRKCGTQPAHQSLFTDVFRSRPLLCTIHPVPQLLASTRGDELSRALCLTWDIRDSILVDDDGANQSTELDKRVPVGAIAGETRRLDRKHGTDMPVADSGQQPLEAGA